MKGPFLRLDQRKYQGYARRQRFLGVCKNYKVLSGSAVFVKIRNWENRKNKRFPQGEKMNKTMKKIISAHPGRSLIIASNSSIRTQPK